MLEVQHHLQIQRALRKTLPPGVPYAFSPGTRPQDASLGYMWGMKAPLSLFSQPGKSLFHLGQMHLSSSLI